MAVAFNKAHNMQVVRDCNNIEELRSLTLMLLESNAMYKLMLNNAMRASLTGAQAPLHCFQRGAAS